MTMKATSWERVPIKKVYEGLYDGPHATPAPSEDGPVFLGIKNVTDDGRLDLSEIRNISETEFPRWTKRVLPQEGDIVFTYEATLNRYAIIPKGFRGCLGRRMALIRTNPEKIDNRFLFQYFFGADWRSTINKNILSGSTVDRIPLSKFPDFEINLPPLETQRKIASILSSYDYLIENNTRRIKNLEEMARMIYREWFVNFHFPGHEQVKMVDSPLGIIPEGWEVRDLLDLSEVTYGFAFKADQFSVEPIGKPVIRIRDVLEGRSSTYSTEKPADKYLVQNGDVLVGMDGDFHMGFWVGGEAYLVQRVARFRSKGDMSNYHLFLAMEKPIQDFNATITGTTVAHLGDKHIKTIQVAWPDTSLRAKANQVFESILKQLLTLRLKNQNLRQTRDLLLPKLISGEVAV